MGNMLLHFIIMCLFTLPFTTISLGTLRGSNSSSMSNISKPNCSSTCGDITVPYPFGIGNDTGCSLDDSFYVTCKTSVKPPKLFLGSSNIEIYSMSDSDLRINTGVSYKCYDINGNVTKDYYYWTSLGDDVFTFSEKNMFTVIGCDDLALIEWVGDNYFSGCVANCSGLVDVQDGRCSGEGCCQTPIRKGLKYYNVTLISLRNHRDIWSINDCGYAFLGDVSTFKFLGASDLSRTSGLETRAEANVQVVVDWVIRRDQNCTQATECKQNSHCYDVDGGGYRCKCNNGYEGSPYLDQGCQDINECEDPGTYPCYGICNNTLGSYNCTCKPGTDGNATIQNDCQAVEASSKASKFSWTIFVIAMALGLFVILSGIMVLFFGIRRRKLTKLREKFFEQNGGVLLKQKLNSQGSHEAMALFSTQQLRKATNNYSQDQIIGRGGYGVVYKGVLSDERVVAVKKSKLVDGGQAEQFINEIMIVTQVIHRNVVKLLGCCLEEEVPVLVYEFISNNTLFHHLHYRSGGAGWLSWDNRLRVAIETAVALAYLHSETIMPIIHRDVKSTNILIDDNYTAKISDFGASRLVPLDHDQVTTLIQGTLGYLDPEYFNTSQLTEKSDVYSFGVVLTELITGKKPIGVDRNNTEKNLASYFVNSIKENRLFEIVEPRLLREGTLEQLQAIGNLIKRCLSSQGCDRPTMKEVAAELEGMRKLSHPWLQQQADEETQSLVLEVEQSDLYDVPLVSYTTNEWETSSCSTDLAFGENKPR